MQIKLIKTGNTTVIIMPNGITIQKDNIPEEQITVMLNTDDEEEIYKIMDPDYLSTKNEIDKLHSLIDRVSHSDLLTYDTRTSCIYWYDVSPLSLPLELVEDILNAEEVDDADSLTAYKNFWTLMSLNPDEQCRKNLYWFLQRNGLVISNTGFFVAYRNVCYTNEEGVYTDQYTHTFKIKLGEVVKMRREECDSDSNVCCSKGLHLGSRDWLQRGYFGEVGLVCLCNPAEVVAVPKVDNYGKLRCCAYLPIDIADFDIEGNVIPYKEKTGFACKYLTRAIYEGIFGTEENGYKIVIPTTYSYQEKKNLENNILEIAKQCIVQRSI